MPFFFAGFGVFSINPFTIFHTMKKDAMLYFIVGLVIVIAAVILVFGIFFLNDNDPRETYETYYLRLTKLAP